VRPFCLVKRRKEIGKGDKELEDRRKRQRERERERRKRGKETDRIVVVLL